MIVPCLLAGGSGTRLWPLSRTAFPKQFLKLFGDNTLLQATALRAKAISPECAPIIICGEDHRFVVAEQLRAAGIDKSHIILEPVGRNTAPAAAIAALFAQKTYGDDAQVLIMAADHAIADEDAFVSTVKQAQSVAAMGKMTVFGIHPTRPETGYGYIKSGKEICDGGKAVDAFVEKPDAARAQTFLDEGNYYWNGGLFQFPASVLLKELEQFEPDMLKGCKTALDKSVGDLDFIRLDKAAFSGVRSESLDYAVMEKTAEAALVPLNCGWDDVGAWTYLANENADKNGNVLQGDVVAESCSNTLVKAESRLVTTVGMKDCIVIETKDAVMVAATDSVQSVKTLVGRLQKAGRPETTHHATILRPWGSYETLALGQRFQVKRIIVKPGQKLSLQMHHHRAEHWIVVSGTATVTCGEKVFMLGENESTYIPLGAKHRLENPGRVPVELIEVQSGGYLGEDDIVRFDDVYGRAAQ